MTWRELRDGLRERVEARLPEDDPTISIFDGRDAAHDGGAYLVWTREHRHKGYIINSPRRPRAGGLKLHRATCELITDKLGSGSHFVEGDFIKVCSTDRQLLEEWAQSTSQGEASSGCYCMEYAGPPLSYHLLVWLAKRLS